LFTLQGCGGEGGLSALDGDDEEMPEEPFVGEEPEVVQSEPLERPPEEPILDPNDPRVLELEPEPEAELPYEEAACPEQPPAEPNYQCEPFTGTNTCGPGLGCVPYLIYPDDEPCASATYGSYCAVSGEATQGEVCGEEGKQCAAGFLCVVGALSGLSCGQICVPGMSNACAPGLICGETDVPGVGVCF
jgi:hypothetical protein